jgi:hypothetical protein
MPIETTEVLYDLELSTVARVAMPNEIEEAAQSEQKLGMRQVTVMGRVYGVMPAAEAARAALEARGEEPDAIDRAIGTDADIDLDSESDSADLVVTPPIQSGPSTSDDRAEWPSLEELTSPEAHRQRAHVTARDYLARPSPEASGA